MIRSGPAAPLVAMAIALLALAGCASQTVEPGPAAVPPPLAAAPASIPARDLVGRWGYAAYHNDADRTRTEVAARGQCKQPYVIGMGPTGGVTMLQADQAEPQELRLKGGPGGKNYVGPAGEAAGDVHDREIVSFDGRVLVLRWLDPEVAGRYGTGIFVRCSARA